MADRRSYSLNLPSDFFNSPRIKGIKALDKSDPKGTVLLYLNLLCSTTGKNGVFSIANIPLTDDTLHNVFDYEDIGAKLAVLEKADLIKRHEKKIEVFKYWQEGHDRNSPRYKKWRMAVFVRDDFRCQHCGSEKLIQAHHIKSWKNHEELRYEVSNGITLCHQCHLKAHGGSWRNGD